MAETIYRMFDEWRMVEPALTAVEDENRSLTFSLLDALAATVQGMLPEGVRRVGVVMDHGVEQIAAILGILRAGAAYVPAEPTFPDGRIRFMMEDCAADCIVSHGAYAGRFDGSVPIVLVEQGFQANESVPAPVVAAPDDLAYVLYASGSTGRPKGVAVEQRNVCHYARAFNHEFRNGPGDTMLQYSVCSFDIFVEEVFASLLNGAAVAVPAPRTKHNLAALMDFVESRRITMMSGFPYLLMDMNDLPQIPQSLRLLISGGDVLRASYVSHLAGKVAVYNTYGPSETTVCATYFHCEPGTQLEDGTYPVGHAVLGDQVRILDDDLHAVAPGEVGEICISGGGVSRGYIGNADKQAAYFVDMPDGSRLYRSGDLGYQLPSGDIAFLHRKDNQVMVWGRRVEPDGVQRVLCSCGGVKTGAVRAYLDEHGLASYLVAYYVASTDIAEDDLRAEMEKVLPAYMVPERFVELQKMPLTPNGKVDSLALPRVERGGGMSEVLIKRAHFADLKLIMEWRERVLRDVFDVPADHSIDALMAQNRAYYSTHLADGTHEACFAVLDDTIVGCGGVCFYDEMPSPDNPNGRCAYVMNVYVAPDARNCGIASQIVAWLVERAEAKGAGKVYLETTDAARRLYENAGFKPMEDYLKLDCEEGSDARCHQAG